MKRFFLLLLAICLLLSGCSTWMDGSYHSVKPHIPQGDQVDPHGIQVSDYAELYQALKSLTNNGLQNAVISVADYDQEKVEPNMRNVVSALMTGDPITAYAVKEIEFEIGVSTGRPAIAVEITYLHNLAEIREIRKVTNAQNTKEVVTSELRKCTTGVVLYVENYMQIDFAQIAEDYAAENPQRVMELPSVAVNVYPEWGKDRIVELKFTYQTSRNVLRTMQSMVTSLFDAAAVFVSGYEREAEKFDQLYSWLAVRYDYRYETSITPTYSLLLNGVGDSKAFATVYRALCEKAGLECEIISGTREGEAWFWNLIRCDGKYYHVDITSQDDDNRLLLYYDEQMNDNRYVWDYSAYPATEQLPQPDPTEPEQTEPTETPSEATVPENTAALK